MYVLIFAAIFMVGIAVPAVSAAQAGDDPITQEYFVQQAADEDLLITINAFEAEFESQISGQNGEMLLRSGIPGSRIVPVFQYVDAPEDSRQLDIEVVASRHTVRSQFELELTRLKIWDERSSSVSRAYRLLSFGMLASQDVNEANWTVKIDSLINAGRLFQQFGMLEMRLWSNYLAAHLIQFYLHDYSIVYSMTREILADLKGERLQTIELAALQLQSVALIGLRNSGNLSISANNPDPVQSALARAAELARAMGYEYERASALFTSGAEYVAGEFYTEALERFQLAVQIADSTGDAELATGIRESIVVIHAIQGNTQASSDVLQKIETQLLEDGSGDELALNLLAQGRLYIRNYRYIQAVEVLYQALGYENDSAIRRQINFDLARVFYETGRLDESMSYLQLAEIRRGTISQKRINPVVDVGEGLRLMANIHRTRGEYASMKTARNAEGLYHSARAQYAYDQGQDEIASTARNNQRAQSLFRQSYQAANRAGHPDLQHLSRLQFCALASRGDSLCSKAAVKASYEWLLRGGVPRFSAQAMYLWAQILVLNGRHSEAIAVMDSLVDEIHLLRYSLPGVLGAWYREQHEQLFEYYLELLATASRQRGRADGLASLLVLSKIRYIEKQSASDAVSDVQSGNTGLLRVQLAQREDAGSGQVLSVLNENINRGLADLRVPFRKKFEHLSNNGLQKYLRSLANDEIVLTYHISPTTAQVWVAQKARVQWRNIANPAYIYAALQEARQGLADIGVSSFNSKMDALGRRLITPVAEFLGKTIYWIPAGSLLGFPLDALRVDGSYLVESHSVVNLMSFPANTNPRDSLQTGSPQTVFLAGHPQDYTGDYATRLDTSPEIQAVTDIFVGPGLRIVQGAALLPDEFKGEQFQQAELAHLSMPGIIDLKYPRQSSFVLSGSESISGRTSLKPEDIRLHNLNADLVFLSNTRVKEIPVSGFTSQPGLVSDFMGAGANSVIARLWTNGAGTEEVLITDFYRKLEASGNIARSLTDTKRRYLENNRENGLYDWAGYQLFIN